MGSARRRASGRPDDCGSAAGRAKLGPARSLTGEAFGHIALVQGNGRIQFARLFGGHAFQVACQKWFLAAWTM